MPRAISSIRIAARPGLLLALFLGVGETAVGADESAPSERSPRPDPTPGAILTFHPEAGRVFLTATINGTGPHRLLVDTGYGLTMIQPELAESLDLPRAGRVDIIGIAGRETAAMYRGLEFSFGDLVYRPRRVAALPSHRGRHRERQGILGSGFFRRFVVAIDFRSAEVQLFDPDAFHYSGPGEILPLRFESRIPVVDTWMETPAGDKIKATLEIDTGCDGALCLGRRFIQSQEWLRSDSRRGGQRRGVGGSARTDTGTIPTLTIGSNRWHRVSASLFLENDLVEEGYAGHLGCEVLRACRVLFDYSRDRLILENNMVAEPEQ